MEEVGILTIPIELLMNIFEHLTPQALACCAQTCKQLHHTICSDTFLWEPVVESFLRCELNSSPPCPPTNYFTRYSTIWSYYGFLLNPWGSELPEHAKAVIWVEAAGQNLRGSVIVWHWNEIRAVLEAFSLPSSLEDECRPLVRIHPVNKQFVSRNHAPTPLVQLTDTGQRRFLKPEDRSEVATLSILRSVPPHEVHRQPGGHLYRPLSISLNHTVYYPRCVFHDHARSHVAEGLWTACYSTHGIELLQLEIVREETLRQSTTDNRVHSDDPSEAVYANMPNVQYIHSTEGTMPLGTRLVGHKCTGDHNIPADTDSFVIQMDQLLPPLPFARRQTATYPVPLTESVPLASADEAHHGLLVSAIHPGVGRIAWTWMVQANWSRVFLILFHNEPNRVAICWLEMNFHLLFLSRVDFHEDNGTILLPPL